MWPARSGQHSLQLVDQRLGVAVIAVDHRSQKGVAFDGFRAEGMARAQAEQADESELRAAVALAKGMDVIEGRREIRRWPR